MLQMCCFWDSSKIYTCLVIRERYYQSWGFNIVVLSFINLNRPLGIMQNKSNYVLLLKGRRNLLLCYGLYTIVLISCYGRRGSVANHTLEYLHVFVIHIPQYLETCLSDLGVSHVRRSVPSIRNLTL